MSKNRCCIEASKFDDTNIFGTLYPFLAATIAAEKSMLYLKALPVNRRALAAASPEGTI
jgi:hypothetical protein